MDRTLSQHEEIGSFFSFVKAIGILCILFHHFSGLIFVDLLRIPETHQTAGILPFVFDQRLPGTISIRFITAFSFYGDVGIELFIIASGFGLHRSLLKRREPWREFYKRRFFRVIPLYWLSLFIPLFFGVIDLQTFFLNFALLQVFTSRWYYWGLWFVGYIVQLYLLFPILIYIIKTLTPKFKLALLIISFFFDYFVREFFLKINYELTGIPVTKYLPYFLFGILLAQYPEEKINFRRSFDRIGSLVALFGLAFIIYMTAQYDHFINRIRPVFIFLFFASLILPYLMAKKSKALTRISSTLAYSSYSIYLFHFPCLYIIVGMAISKGYGDSLQKLLITTALCFFVSIMLGFAIQNSYNKMIEKMNAWDTPYLG